MTPHWTDHATDRPIFDTVIDTRGPNGNINAIVATAARLMRRIGVPSDRAEALRKAVLAAHSYDEAVALIERWFRVRRWKKVA